jgi:hypothetical protein
MAQAAIAHLLKREEQGNIVDAKPTLQAAAVAIA